MCIFNIKSQPKSHLKNLCPVPAPPCPGIELNSLRQESLPGIHVFADEKFSCLVHALVEGPEDRPNWQILRKSTKNHQ